MRYLMAALLLALPALAAAEDFHESVSVEPGGELEIRLDAGSIEVETHDLDEVSADAFSHGGLFGRGMRFELTSDGADAELRGEGRGFFGGHARVRVRIPRRYSLDARTSGGAIVIEELDGDVKARTSGGKIELDGARGVVELRTSGGSITVSNVEGDVRARTSGGPIRVSDVQGEIEVSTSGGPIRIHDVAGPVKARTSGGWIEVRFSSSPEGEIRTSGGWIAVEIPEGAGVDLDARTSGGRIVLGSDELSLVGDVERNHIEGEINGGGPNLQLRTSGGNVRIHTR